MDILGLARQDARNILKEGGFEVLVTLESPSLEIADITGIGVIRNELVDFDGQDGNARLVSISIHEDELKSVNYTYLNSDDQPKLMDHKVSFIDSNGTLNTYKVSETRWNRTLGILNLILGDYAPSPAVGYDPFTDLDLSIYYNATKLILNVDNIYGNVNGLGLINLIKNAVNIGTHDVTEGTTTAQPILSSGSAVFDGVNDELRSSGVPSFISNNEDFTCFAVFDISNVSQNFLVFQNENSINYYQISSSLIPDIKTRSSGGIKKITSNTSFIVGNKLVIQANFKHTDWNAFFNGVEEITPDASLNTPLGVDTISIGSLHGSASNVFAAMSFRGLLVYDKLITDPLKISDIHDFITSDM